MNRGSRVLRRDRDALPLRQQLLLLQRTTLVEVSDWRCNGSPHVSGDEENDGFDLVFTRQGCFERETAGRSDFIDAGVTSFWHPAQRYRIRHPVSGGDACSVFRFPEHVLRELLAALEVRSGEAAVLRMPAVIPIGGREYLLHRMAMNAASRGDVLESDECTIALATRLLRQAYQRPGSAPSAAGVARDHARRAGVVLAASIGERLSLTEISRRVDCSPFHLSRMVRQATGMPIYQLELRIRLRAALERLLDSREPISTIAHAAGFSSHSHFSHAFRREFRVTPAAVRRGRLGFADGSRLLRELLTRLEN